MWLEKLHINFVIILINFFFILEQKNSNRRMKFSKGLMKRYSNNKQKRDFFSDGYIILKKDWIMYILGIKP